MRKQVVAPILASAILVLSAAGCSESVDSLVASGDAALAKGDYRTASIQLKSALQRDPENARARWLLGEIGLAMENGADAEKEIRRAGEAGVGDDAVLPALAQALLLQGKADEVLGLAQPAGLSPRAQGELMAARGLAHLAKGETEQAGELTAQALALAPDSKLTMTARARVLVNFKQLDEAEQLLSVLQQKHPSYGAAWGLMGDIQDVRGDLPKAEQAYTTAIEKRPVPFADLLKRAFIRVRQQNLDGALTDAAQLNKALPDLQPAWYATGLAQFLKKDYAKAQDALDRSYQFANDHLPTLILLGWTNLNAGNLAQAVSRAERAMAIAPDVAAVRLLMATVQLRQQQPKRAEETIRPVVAARPESLQAKSVLVAALQAQGKGAEAAPLLEQIAAANPQSLDVQAAVGLDLLRAQEPGKALEILGRAVEQAPAAPQVNEALVSALIRDKKFDEALAAAQRFNEQNPGSLQGLKLLAIAQAGKDDRTGAKATFRKALEVAPGDPVASLMLAELLRSDGDLSGARAVVAKATDRNPDNAGLLTALARLTLQADDRSDEAIDLLRRALQKDPSYRPAQVLLGQQLLARNDPNGAIASLPAERQLNDVAALAVRADARMAAGDAAAAKEDFERLALLLPKSAAVQLKLGLANAAVGDKERMDEALAEAARLDPKDANIGLARARVMAARGELEEARALARSFGLPESDPRLLATELLIAEQRGDPAERLRYAQQLQNAVPAARHALLLAQAQYAAGEPAAAQGTLEAWLKEQPDADGVAMELAALYGRTGRSKEAVVILRPLAEKYPGTPAILNNLAWYLRESVPGEALAFAEKAAAAAPDDPAVLDTYATVLALNGQFDRALRTIDTAIQKAKQPAYLRLQRIAILERSGDVATAASELDAFKAGGVPPRLEPKVQALEQRVGRR